MNCKHGLPEEVCALCNPSKDIQLSLTKFARRYGDLCTKELAKKALEKMTAHQQHRLLLSLLKSSFDSIRRADAHAIEQAASPYEQERKERQRENSRRSVQTRRDNDTFLRETPWRASYGKVRQEWVGMTSFFRKARLERLEPGYAKYLEERGDTEYIGGDYTSYSVMKAFKDFEDNIRTDVTLELTEELLGSSFSLADGRSVTWGEATVADHKVRINLLLAQASGTVTTAKLHKAAVKMLIDLRVTKLNDAVCEAAA